MIRIEFQLTYEEYRQAMFFMRAQMTKEMRRGSYRRMWISAAIVFVVGMLASVLSNGWPQRHALPADARVPVLICILLFFAFLALVTLIARRRAGEILVRIWESTAVLQQPNVVTVDDDGIRTETPFTDERHRWVLYTTFAETKAVFLLMRSHYSGEIYPKRAFTDADATAFRAIARAKLDHRSRGFPVLPALSTPLPMPPLEQRA